MASAKPSPADGASAGTARSPGTRSGLEQRQQAPQGPGALIALGRLEQQALRRARRALGCLPLTRQFYDALDRHALGSSDLSHHPERRLFCRGSLSPLRAEDHFIWLIHLGVLRREVDGQGLTERVRLTPLGRQALGGWRGPIPTPPLLDRLLHTLQRHRPRL